MKGVTVILGGVSPLGRALADRVLQRGDFVALLDADGPALDEADGDYGNDAVVVEALDITDSDEIADTVEGISEDFGAPTALVIVIESGSDPGLIDAGAEGIAATVQQRILGPMTLIGAVAERMEAGGSIVLALPGDGTRALSFAVNAALLGFMRGAVAELGQRGIRINAVIGGGADAKRAPLGRNPANGDIAAAVLGFLGEDLALTSGQILAFNGSAGV
jgi:NAD(P)-dependent dehydrogenase (short-subunit alcohol dehydrogenase family)